MAREFHYRPEIFIVYHKPFIIYDASIWQIFETQKKGSRLNFQLSTLNEKKIDVEKAAKLITGAGTASEAVKGIGRNKINVFTPTVFWEAEISDFVQNLSTQIVINGSSSGTVTLQNPFGEFTFGKFSGLQSKDQAAELQAGGRKDKNETQGKTLFTLGGTNGEEGADHPALRKMLMFKPMDRLYIFERKIYENTLDSARILKFNTTLLQNKIDKEGKRIDPTEWVRIFTGIVSEAKEVSTPTGGSVISLNMDSTKKLLKQGRVVMRAGLNTEDIFISIRKEIQHLKKGREASVNAGVTSYFKKGSKQVFSDFIDTILFESLSGTSEKDDLKLLNLAPDTFILDDLDNEVSLIRQSDLRPISQFQSMPLWESEWLTPDQIISDICGKLNYSYYEDHNGTLIIEPINPSLIGSKSLIKGFGKGNDILSDIMILPKLFIKSMERTESDKDLQTVTSCFAGIIEGAGGGNTPVFYYFVDGSKVYQYGIRPFPIPPNPLIGSDPENNEDGIKVFKERSLKNLRDYVVSQTDRHNAEYLKANIGMVNIPELTPGMNVFVEDHFTIYYINSISRQFTVGSGDDMTLGLSYGRRPLVSTLNYINGEPKGNIGGVSNSKEAYAEQHYRSLNRIYKKANATLEEPYPEKEKGNKTFLEQFLSMNSLFEQLNFEYIGALDYGDVEAI